jgi:DNA-binding NtrC family response regulator
MTWRSFVAQNGPTDLRSRARVAQLCPESGLHQQHRSSGESSLSTITLSLVRRGLRALIDPEPDLTVCAHAASLEDRLGAIDETRPDLVIADFSLGPDDGLELVKAIRSRHAGLRVLVLTMHNDRDAAHGDAERAARRDVRGASEMRRAAHLRLDAQHRRKQRRSGIPPRQAGRGPDVGGRRPG